MEMPGQVVFEWADCGRNNALRHQTRFLFIGSEDISIPRLSCTLGPWDRILDNGMSFKDARAERVSSFLCSRSGEWFPKVAGAESWSYGQVPNEPLLRCFTERVLSRLLYHPAEAESSPLGPT